MAPDGAPQRLHIEEEAFIPSARADEDANVQEVDPDLVGWDGPNDLENPMNWPESKKWTNIGLMSLLTIIS